MKKRQTSSENVFILSNMDSSLVRKYYKKKPQWYMLSVPPKYIFKTIDHCNIKHPSLYKKRFKYIDLEYISGKVLNETFDKTALIGLVCNCIYEFKKVNCSDFFKHIKWTCNSEFLQAQANNMIKIISKSKYNEKFAKLGLGTAAFEKYLSSKLDDQRPLSLIHGNLVRDNFINNNGNFYLIDWEEATYGDTAYELAIHLISEDYSKDEMGMIIERVCASNPINQNSLINDISLYISFEYKRKALKGIYDCMMLFRKGKSYILELEKIYEIYSKVPGHVSKDEVKMIIESK